MSERVTIALRKDSWGVHWFDVLRADGHQLGSGEHLEDAIRDGAYRTGKQVEIEARLTDRPKVGA